MPNILLRKLSKTGNPTYAPAQIERTRDPFKKKGEKKKNLHRHRSHHFTFLNVTNYCIFSSAHNQPPLELESISPLLLLPPPSPSSVYRTRSIHTTRYEFSIEIYQWETAAMVLIGPDTRPSFPALRETKGVDCERGTKTPATPLKNETNRGARRESVTRIEEQTGGPARINQISALSVRKSDSCGVASSTGGGEGRTEREREWIRKKSTIVRDRNIRFYSAIIYAAVVKKKKEGEGSRRSYGDEDLFKSFLEWWSACRGFYIGFESDTRYFSFLEYRILYFLTELG